jgi:N-sulfoglucosamine sulfohydrolase
MSRPNILYLHSHDTGRYIQPFGRAVPTPNLQRLAEGGVLFRQAFCAAPVCSASRSALLTGQSPHSAGMIGLAHRGFRLNDYRQHLAQFLGSAGYHTVLAGVQHEAPAPGTLIGYHEILPLRHPDEGPVRSGRTADIAAAAAAFLGQPALRTPVVEPAQPFFLSVGFNDTHREFPVRDPRDDPRYILPPAPLPDLPEVREDMAQFIASARVLDDGVGQVLAALSEGLANDTLVIATTDHGIAFPGMKCTLTDHGLGVHLILRWLPGKTPERPAPFLGGEVVDAMVSHLDIYPTLCELLGLAKPAWLQGRSLLPLLRGEIPSLHEELFGEVTYHAAYEPMRSVRTDRWKYIRRFAGPRRVLPNTDDSPSKTALLARGWGETLLPGEQLFDLAFDPNEAHNLAGDAAHAGPLSEMRARLERWMRATHDPLLDGPVPAPPGALVNDPGGLSPQETPRRVGE